MLKSIKTYFFDTYAMYEIISGNKNYEKYCSNICIITTKLNLMELHYCLLQKYEKEKADKYFEIFNRFTISISDQEIKKANYLKKKLKKRKLSYVDCIGYIIAKEKNIKFLTGDMQFQQMENVEFIK